MVNIMKDKVETQDSDFEPRVYEVGYLIVPSVAQENLPEKVTAIRSVIESVKGSILDEGEPRYQDLAYDMATTINNKKVVHKAGYFGWLKCEIDPASIESIDEKLKADTELIRFIIIKTVREDTLAPIEAAFTAEREEKARKEREKMTVKPKTEEEEVKDPASKEEIDETIDKLIVD